ncbi:uncharacterized protein L201_005959 [Kwoniella dendrophila CBS 6074]|uniref:Fork-head domain-containing protein n=1 Tax=Kwoniella dendrophila CBS 6074 TaxID=1295534 RepID=A0AAX4K0W3_9TREE
MPTTTTTSNSLIQPIDIELEIDPQLTQSQSQSVDSPPSSNSKYLRPNQNISQPPSSSPFGNHQRIFSTSPPPSLERNLHTSPMQPPYPNTPSPQSYGLTGTVIVNEHPSIMQSQSSMSECGSQSDVFMSQALPKNPKPILRPSMSQNNIHNTPSPSSWPRRIMTTGSVPPPPTFPMDDRINGSMVRQQSVPSIAPAVNFSASTSSAVSENNNTSTSQGIPIVHGHQSQSSHHQHEANTPYLSTSVSSTSSVGSHLNSLSHISAHPHLYPQQHQPQTYYNHPQEESHYPSSYDGYPSSTSSPWQQPMSTIIPHHQQQQPQQQQQQQSPYHWGMHHMAIPQKQDEPILAPGELPAPRPPMSYAALIGEALLLAPPPHQLYVSEISDSIKKRYPYYRQNPTKIYNGVRHQTSMCKAFVKLPRPFGDQSGGARKWAIRAGCEGWFAGGGYHPPSSSAATSKPPKIGGKAKATARSKHLIIGTASEDRKSRGIFGGAYPDSGSSGEGPSSGPAYDGTSRPLMPYPTYGNQQPLSNTNYGAPAPPPPSNQHLPPGYHYVPIQPAHGHPQPTQPIYVPVWGPYATPQPQHQQGYPQPQQHVQSYPQPSQSPEDSTWSRGMNHSNNGNIDTQSNDGSVYDEVKLMPQPVGGSPAPSHHSISRSIHSSHGASPETM